MRITRRFTKNSSQRMNRRDQRDFERAMANADDRVRTELLAARDRQFAA